MLKFFNLAIQLVACLLIFMGCERTANSNQETVKTTHGIIPLPQRLVYGQGRLLLDHDFTLVSSDLFQLAGQQIENSLNFTLNTYLVNHEVPSGKTCLQFISDPLLHWDAYKISVSSEGIKIVAGNPEAAFLAAQTLKQILWQTGQGEKRDTIGIPCMEIEDEPAYSWRGFHVDLSRHLFTKDYLFKLIDLLSYYKFNKLQLHLTDDQGWRVESTVFPLLNETGSWRPFNHDDSACLELAKQNPDYQINDQFIRNQNGFPEYGGYLTKADLKEIIDYAGLHFIEIIPEIDMPGHMAAAITAYPFLSCQGTPGWGNEFSVPICPCKDTVMDFAFRVWDEILDIFPSSWVHIGADEVEKTTWESSQACNGFMNLHDLHDVSEIQNYFVTSLQKHLEARGKKVIAWDDVLDGKVDNNLIIMYWRDWMEDSPQKAAENGNGIIFARWDLFYLSSDYSDVNLQDLYDFKPSANYPEEISAMIQGFQGCVWTEMIPSERVFEKHTFPRLQALSEVAWTNTRDWYSFTLRMKSHFSFMQSMYINYSVPGFVNLSDK